MTRKIYLETLKSALGCSIYHYLFLFRCFLLLAVSIFALYLSLCLYPDLSNASWYEITELLKISSEEDNDESRDSIESGSFLMIDDGWLDSMFIYFI